MTTVSGTGGRTGGPGHVMARLVLGVVVFLTSLWSYAAPAQALPAPHATSCAGVWVVVDYGALGGTSTACAGSYSTGMAALRGAGFTPTLDAGMVVRVNGLPATPNTQANYWSYWHATRQADGSYSAWSYSSVGPSSYYPTAGGAEGWRYEPVGGGYVAPGAVPPKQTATTQAPATTTRSTTAATKAATKVSSQTTTQAAPAATTDSGSQSAPATSAGVETPTSTPVTIDSASDTSSSAPVQPSSAAMTSLLGGVVAIVVIAVGAVGMLLRKKLAARG